MFEEAKDDGNERRIIAVRKEQSLEISSNTKKLVSNRN